MEKLKNMKETLAACVQTQLMNVAGADTHELGEAVDMIKDLEEAMYYCAKTKALEDEKKEHEEMKKKLEKMEKENPKEFHHYYSERIEPMMYCPPEMMMYPYERDMDREMGRMYYSSRQPRNSRGEFTSRRGGGSRNYEDEYRYYGGDGNSSGGSSGGNSGRGGNNSGGSRNYYEREMPFEFRDSREGRSGVSRRNYMESKEMHQDKEKKIKELEKYMQELSQDIVEMIEDASPEEKQMLEKKMTHLTSKIAQLN